MLHVGCLQPTVNVKPWKSLGSADAAVLTSLASVGDDNYLLLPQYVRCEGVGDLRENMFQLN